MSTRDLLLAELYNTPRDDEAQASADRHAPVLYFDANEPFLPLAAGYTLFTQDGPSPSFDRLIELRPEGQPAAAMAIEYAIWWDWDIHHLYELEHVWVYIDANDQPVRVEGSWHGKFYNIPLKLENGRAVLLSEPGKHAFAPDPSWFHQRIRDYRRAETLAVGLHAHVLINNIFGDKIRWRAFDRVLVRSFLLRNTFTPAWNFSQRFSFQSSWLVPWPTLHRWIPQRVNTLLERLETNTRPADYRALRLASTDGTLAGLQAVARTGVDAIITPLSLSNDRLVLGSPLAEGQPLSLDEALEFCRHEPVGAFLELSDPAVIDRLAWFIRSNELSAYVVVISADASLLARYNSFIQNGVTAIQLNSPDQDPLQAARQSGAVFVSPRWAPISGSRQSLAPEWIERVHNVGLGIISWPVDGPAEIEALQSLGLDVIWEKQGKSEK